MKTLNYCPKYSETIIKKIIYNSIFYLLPLSWSTNKPTINNPFHGRNTITPQETVLINVQRHPHHPPPNPRSPKLPHFRGNQFPGRACVTLEAKLENGARCLSLVERGREVQG